MKKLIYKDRFTFYFKVSQCQYSTLRNRVILYERRQGLFSNIFKYREIGSALFYLDKKYKNTFNMAVTRIIEENFAKNSAAPVLINCSAEIKNLYK